MRKTLKNHVFLGSQQNPVCFRPFPKIKNIFSRMYEVRLLQKKKGPATRRDVEIDFQCILAKTDMA